MGVLSAREVGWAKLRCSLGEVWEMHFQLTKFSIFDGFNQGATPPVSRGAPVPFGAHYLERGYISTNALVKRQWRYFIITPWPL